MKNKFKSILVVATSLLFFACDTPTSYKQELGLVDNTPSSGLVTTTTTQTATESYALGAPTECTFNYTGTGKGTIYLYTTYSDFWVFGIKVGSTTWQPNSPTGSSSYDYTSGSAITSNGITVQVLGSAKYTNSGKSVGTTYFSGRLKISSKGSKTSNCLKFEVTGATTISVYVSDSSKTGAKAFVIESEEVITTTTGDSLYHTVDKDSEGYYIEDKYWSSGEITSSNKLAGEIWSFEAVEGQSYAVYLYDKNFAMYAYDGESFTNFSKTCLTPCEQKYKYSYSENLYDRPAIITPTTSGTHYIKVLGTNSLSLSTEYYRTGQYDICVTKGRDGESFVDLTLIGVNTDAWVDGELLFNKKDAWYDYQNDTVSDWVDYNCYRFEVSAGQECVLYGAGKEDSSDLTGNPTMSACYYNGTDYSQIFTESYEYVDNDSFVQGYPFSVPNDIALESDETKKYIYLYIQPELEDGANSVTVDGENIGTYRVAVKRAGEFIALENYYGASQYQLIITDPKKIAVGSVLNFWEFAYLEKYDGTKVSNTDENLTGYWGDGFEKLPKYAYWLCKEETTDTYLQFSYPTDGVTLYYWKYLNILPKEENSSKVTIEISDESLFCVGNYASATLKYGTTDVTSSAVWAWYNPNAESPTITNCDTKGLIPCYEEGSLYILVYYSATDDLVYKEVTVKPASENSYSFAVSNDNATLLESSTFSLSKNSVDITSTVTSWEMASNNFIDFESATRTAIFYRAGIDYTLTATLSDGTKVFTSGTVKDKANLTVPLEVATRLTTIYNNYGSTTVSDSPLGTEVEEYNITLTGSYSNYSYTNLVAWLKYATVPVNLDMNATTGMLGLDATTTVSNYTVGVLYNCKIKSISLPSDTTTIPAYAFKHLTSGSEIILESITMPNSVTSIENDAFYGAKKLTTVNLSTGLTSIGARAFNGTSNLTSITLPEGLTSIGVAAFYISGLTSITIPSSVTTLDGGIFAGCASLESAVFESGSTLTALPDETFFCCTSFKTVTLPESLVSIGSSCFASKTADNYVPIESIMLPTTLTTIGGYAFEYCSKLTSISIPSGVTTIGDFAFKGCAFTEATIPSTVTSLGSSAFSSCSALKTVTFADSMNSSFTILKDGLFSECLNLTTVNIPSTVKSIYYKAFYNCTSLESIVLPAGLTSLAGYAFDGCTSLKTVNIPSGVTCLYDYTFSGCPLTSIELPSSLSSIGTYCFNGATFAEVTIPATVTKIGPNAFSNNSNLNAVYFDYNLSWSYSSYSTKADSTATVINVRYYEDNANYLKSTYANYYWHKDDRIKVLDYHTAYLTDDIMVPVTKDTETTLRFYVANMSNNYIIYFEEYHNPDDPSAVYDQGNYNLTDGKFEIYNPSGTGLYSHSGTTSTNVGYGVIDLYSPNSYTTTAGYHKIKILPQSDSISDGYIFLHITCLSSSLSTTSCTPVTTNYTSSLSYYAYKPSIKSGYTYAYTFYVSSGSTYTIQWLDLNTDIPANTGASSTLLTNGVDAMFMVINSDNTQWWNVDDSFSNSFSATNDGTYKLYIWTASPPTRNEESGNVAFRIYKH